MDWFSYFEVAQEWADGGEAHKRSAVSRAYYAMYCTARNKLDDAGRYNPPDCGSSHIHVWNFFKEDSEHPDRRPIGVLGTRLRRARNRADYCDFIDDFFDDVETAMDNAAELKELLEELRI